MNAIEILSDSLKYSISSKKDLLKLLPFTAVMLWVYAEGSSFGGYEMPLYWVILLFISILFFILLGDYALTIVKYGISRSEDFPELSFKNFKKGFVLFLIISFVNTGLVSLDLTFTIGDLTLNFDVLYYIWFAISIFLIGRYAYIGDFWKALNLNELWISMKTLGIMEMIVNVIIMAVISALSIVPFLIALLIISMSPFSIPVLIIVLICFIVQILVAPIIFVYYFRSVGLICSNVYEAQKA